MQKLILLLPVISLLCFPMKAQDDKNFMELINEAAEVPVYVLFQSISRDNINIQDLQTLSHVTLTAEEIQASQAKVIELAMPEEFKVVSDSIVEILNKQFETTKFIKAQLKNEYFNGLGMINWSFEKRPLFVFISINANYEINGMDAATRNNDVEKSLSIRWKLSIVSNTAFSHVNEKDAYRVYTNYPTVYYGPVFSVKNIQPRVEDIALIYNPSKSIGPFSRKFDFFTKRFIDKQKKIIAKKKK